MAGQPHMSTFDDGDMERVLEMCEQFRIQVAMRMPAFADPNECFRIAMAAGVVFAGMQAGHLIALGEYVETPEQRQAFAQMMINNFPIGVELGKVHAMRQIAELEKGIN